MFLVSAEQPNLKDIGDIKQKLKENLKLYRICPQPEGTYFRACETDIKRTGILAKIKKDLENKLKELEINTNKRMSLDLNTYLNEFIDMHYCAFENNDEGKEKFLRELKVEMQNREWGKQKFISQLL